MISKARRILCGIGWAGFLALLGGVAGITPYPESGPLRSIQRAAVLLDAPISAVGLLLPFKGVWLFFVPPNFDRGIAPELFPIMLDQLIIGIPTYLAIFWALARLSRLVRSSRPKSEVLPVA